MGLERRTDPRKLNQFRRIRLGPNQRNRIRILEIMEQKEIQIGFVTDEVSRDIVRSLSLCDSWGVNRFELREGRSRRFPFFDGDEVAAVHRAIERGAKITAVSPGVFKSPIEDAAAIETDLIEKIPRALRRAKEFGCSRMIIFGFEMKDKNSESRAKIIDVLKRTCVLAQEAGVTLAVENEPNFWFDGAQDCVDFIEEIDNPYLRLNWDPANSHWGGHIPTRTEFETVRPYMVNLHVKDYQPNDPAMPWRPVGEGVTPWEDILGWVYEARQDGFDLNHVTIETHYVPGEEGSKRSLDRVRLILGELRLAAKN